LDPCHQAVQCAHAAFAFYHEYPEITRDWFENSSYLILVEVPDEDSLDEFRDEVCGLTSGIPVRYVSVYEPDMNEELTAIALEPTEQARKLCSNLPLILKSEAVMV
jgi:hypothetical protein